MGVIGDQGTIAHGPASEFICHGGFCSLSGLRACWYPRGELAKRRSRLIKETGPSHGVKLKGESSGHQEHTRFYTSSILGENRDVSKFFSKLELTSFIYPPTFWVPKPCHIVSLRGEYFPDKRFWCEISKVMVSSGEGGSAQASAGVSWWVWGSSGSWCDRGGGWSVRGGG